MMATNPISITGFTGVNTTTDPYILGKTDPLKSVLNYNFRVRKGVRAPRGGYQSVIDFNSGSGYKKPGVYFPCGSKAILPSTVTDLSTNFFLLPTEGNTQDAFTVEFWYRADFKSYERFICKVPVDITNSNYDPNATMHMAVSLYHPFGSKPMSTHVSMYFLILDGSGIIYMMRYVSNQPVNGCDGDWHHMAIVRDILYDWGANNTALRLYQDGSTAPTLMVEDWDYGVSGGPSSSFPSQPYYFAQSDSPLFYQHLELGDDEIALSDFRIWDDRRTPGEIAANYNVPLDGNETGLVTYVPFDDGEGKTFTEKAQEYPDTIEGYFSPQAPFLNDDYELRFTGYKCSAFPSLRAHWDIPDGLTEENRHKTQNEDACYDGGIAWDTCLIEHSSPDYTAEGLHKGVLQIRLKLRQLKEGMIIGRLGMAFDTFAGKYFLFFYDHGNGRIYPSNSIIDGSYVGTTKTITIFYNGTHSSGSYLDFCNIYVDDSDETRGSAKGNWANGDNIHGGSYRPYEDTTGTDATDGRISGSEANDNFCIAFDLIFLRQWYHDFPHPDSEDWEDSDAFDDFIADTYDQETLPDKYRVYTDGMHGHFSYDSRYIFFDNNYFSFDSSTEQLKYVLIPNHFGSDTFDMDGSASYLYTYRSSARVFKSDVIVRRIREWAPITSALLLLASDTTYRMQSIYGLSPNLKKNFNGALISNLVNEYNANTFKNNKRERTVFNKTTNAISATVNVHMTRGTRVDVIEDDTPINGIEEIGGVVYKSRYLILSGDGNRNYAEHNLRSHKPRWCDGPINVTTNYLPEIRGIYRYTSEDEKVDKLLVVAGCCVYELDTTNNVVTPLTRAWIDGNGNEPVNFVALNNVLIIGDTKEAIKINYKGNFSRLGIERPTTVQYNDVTGSDTSPQFMDGEQYGYVVQFYDSENDVLSGTVHINAEHGQNVLVETSDSSHGIGFFEMLARSCKDLNVDRVLFWRTLDLNGDGVDSSFFLVHATGSNRKDAFVYYRDVWQDDKLGDDNQEYLPQKYYGVDLVPPACIGMSAGYNRLFLFGDSKTKSALFWSDVDVLGLAKPDMVPSSYALIIEEGGTTEGRAIVEYNSQVFAFKDNAIFRIYESTAGQFSSELIYKGVGTINQRTTIVAKSSIFFLDTTGIYQYSGGEPVLVSSALTSFFEDNVSQTNIDKSFILHHKSRDILLVFVPSSGSSYCDRCIVADLRNQTFTIDFVPRVTCGYIDNDDIYLGTPYGHVLKYQPSSFVDFLFDATVKTGACSAAGSEIETMDCGSGAFDGDDSIIGSYCFLVDHTNRDVWYGTIIGWSGDSEITVDSWTSLYNASSDPTLSDVYIYSIGPIWGYDKLPIYGFVNNGMESLMQKQLKEVEFFSNNPGGTTSVYMKTSYNHGAADSEATLSITDDLVDTKIVDGLHRNVQLEYCMLINKDIRIKEIAFHVNFLRGRLDQ